MKYIIIFLIFMFVLGCDTNVVYPQVNSQNTDIETLTPQNDQQIDEELPKEIIQSVKPTKSLPLPPSGDNFCKNGATYEGLSPDGVVSAKILFKTTYRGIEYCKAVASFQKNGLSHQYAFFFLEKNFDVWVEKNIDGDLEKIHIFEQGKSLI